MDTKPCKDGYIYRYSYGTGSGSNTLGIDPTNFMTRPFSHEIDLMAKMVHQFVYRNRTGFNLDDAELGECYNHMTIISYYAGKSLNKEARLSKHCDCTYSVHNGKYIPSDNSQLENTSTVVYSLGSTRSLHFNRREIIKGKRGNSWSPSRKCGIPTHITREEEELMVAKAELVYMFYQFFAKS